MKVSGRLKRFMEKMRFKYRVSIMNENTLEESYMIHLSRFTVFLYATGFAIVTFVLLTFIILYTPLRYYLPGYGEALDRSAVMREAQKVDSLLNNMQQQTTYMAVVRGVISGEIKADSVPPIDSLSQVKRTIEFLEKSRNEQDFVRQMENEMNLQQ